MGTFTDRLDQVRWKWLYFRENLKPLAQTVSYLAVLSALLSVLGVALTLLVWLLIQLALSLPKLPNLISHLYHRLFDLLMGLAHGELCTLVIFLIGVIGLTAMWQVSRMLRHRIEIDRLRKLMEQLGENIEDGAEVEAKEVD